MNAFSLTDISYTYENTGQKALREFTFAFPEAATTVILGPNGAGKSTLMDLLLSFRKPSTGTLSLFDIPLHRYTKQELGRLVGLVPQEERSRFAFTAFEFTLFGRAPYLHHMKSPSRQDIHIARQALEDVGLSHLGHRPAGELSGGEHQLLLFARVLAQNPKVILLDEPTSALDPANTARIIGMLTLLKERGKTLIISTHDPSLASEMASLILMMKKGTILYSGNQKEVLNQRCLSDLYQTPITTVPFRNRTLITRDA